MLVLKQDHQWRGDRVSIAGIRMSYSKTNIISRMSVNVYNKDKAGEVIGE